MFHAATLARESKGILLPGVTGAGKTTLAAKLAFMGLCYLTDELVFIPHGTTTLHPFTRPLNLMGLSKSALRQEIDLERDVKHVVHSASSHLISPAVLPLTSRSHEAPLGLGLFPHHQQGDDSVLRRLSGAQAGLALMECLVNARNLPGHGFSEAARLARTVPAYGLRYSQFDQIQAQVEALLQTI
jgi:hypothetical protein